MRTIVVVVEAETMALVGVPVALLRNESEKLHVHRADLIEC